MAALTQYNIDNTKEDIDWFLGEFEEILTENISDKEYTQTHSTIDNFTEKNLLMSMIAYRFENDIEKSKKYLRDAQVAIQKTKYLAEKMATVEELDTTNEPNCLLPVFFEYPIAVSLINRNLDDIKTLYEVYCSDVTAKTKSFPFAQQFSPLLMLGALDKKEEFLTAYSTFVAIKKGGGEQWSAHYVDMLAAIVERDQKKFDALLLDAEQQMQSHGTSKKWGDDVMSGGLEYNAIVYDYQGIAMCNLAKLRGMQVNHYSNYYPNEIIEEV